MTAIREYICSLVSKDEHLSLSQFTEEIRTRFRSEINTKFASDIMSLVADESCHIPDDKLYEYDVLTINSSGTVNSNDTKHIFHAYNLSEGIDYVEHNVALQSKKYYLSPKGFNKCLIRSKNRPEYAEWFNFILEIKIYYKLYQAEIEKSKLYSENQHLITRVADLRSRYDKLLVECFLLIGLNEPYPYHDYYIALGSSGYVARKYENLKRSGYPNAAIVLSMQSQPKDLYTRIIENLRSNIVYSRNYISPIDISHEEFLDEVRQLTNDKYSI